MAVVAVAPTLNVAVVVVTEVAANATLAHVALLDRKILPGVITGGVAVFVAAAEKSPVTNNLVPPAPVDIRFVKVIVAPAAVKPGAATSE